MATTTAGAFTEFIEKLKPTDTQWATIHDRRNVNNNKLAAAFPSTATLVFDRSSLIGSADRATIIRPVDDVDIIAVFDPAGFEQYRFDSKKFIYRVRDALDAGASIAGARGQAVRIFYASGPKADVTPGFARRGGGYLIPKGDGTWQATDPDYHDTYISGRHAALGYHLKPMARLIKAWNRAHSQRLSSFHIECMLATTFVSIGANYREATWTFFDHASASLNVHDPAGHSGDLAAKLTLTQEQAVKTSFASARDRARSALNAEAAGDHADAIRLWRIVFGTGFASYG